MDPSLTSIFREIIQPTIELRPFVITIQTRFPALDETIRDLGYEDVADYCEGEYCPCELHAEAYARLLPVGEYAFTFADKGRSAELQFPTHHERFVVVGMDTGIVYGHIDGDAYAVRCDSLLNLVINVWSRREPIACLHNHCDDLRMPEGHIIYLPSGPDLRVAEEVSRCWTRHPVRHYIVTRDSGYAEYGPRGLIKHHPDRGGFWL